MKNVVLFLWVVCFSSLLHAQEFSYTIEKSYSSDLAETIGLDELHQAPFIPYQYDLHLGFQDKPVWLRFDIKPQSNFGNNKASPFAGDSQIVLRLGPYQLDSIELFEPQDGQWLVQKAGDREFVAQRLCPDDTHCMALSSPPDQPITVFLKVRQRGVLSVRAEAMPMKALAQAVAGATGRSSASIAIAASLFVMALVLLVLERSWLLFTFCIFQVVVIVFILSTTGRLQVLLPSVSPIFLDNLSHHLFSLRVLMFILLGCATLTQYKPSHLYKIFLSALVIILLLSQFLIHSGEIQWAILTYLVVAGLNLFVQFYGIFTASQIPPKIRNLLILAYLVYLFVLVGAILVIFGQLMPVATANFVNSFADWRTNGGPAGVIIFLIVIIQQAEHKLTTNQEMGKLRLDAATSKANQEKLTERQTLIDMLTHELKNPLGTIRFVLASLKQQTRIDSESMARVTRMDRSVERMNELIEHVAHSNKIDRFELGAEKEWVDADELIDEFTSDYQYDGRFTLSIEPGAQFHTYRTMLSVVIENLVNNAYKYDDRRVPIAIKVQSSPTAMLFEIVNSIDPSIRPDQSKLFERYYRHDNVQSLPGMGIGLSLVETAAEKIGAKVRCSVDSHTVTFSLEVPR
jgi:signal transduction histidine kinase